MKSTKVAAFKNLDEKSCEIKGGGHETAAMLWMIINFNKFIIINIIATISWPPPLISQPFHPGYFKAAPFYTA